MLNRYGLFEADERLRGLERKWQATGSPDDKRNFTQALTRAGDSRGHALHMEPHVKAYEAAQDTHSHAIRYGAGSRGGTPSGSESRKARDHAARAVHGAAAEIGRHAGEFILKRKGGDPLMHAHRLAAFHASHNWGIRNLNHADDSQSAQFQFWGKHSATEHAAQFHKSMAHHYPHLDIHKSDWAQGDSVKHKAAVRIKRDRHWDSTHKDGPFFDQHAVTK